MINPMELINDYKEQGYNCEEAVQLVKKEIQKRKIIGFKNDKEYERKAEGFIN